MCLPKACLHTNTFLQGNEEYEELEFYDAAEVRKNLVEKEKQHKVEIVELKDIKKLDGGKKRRSCGLCHQPGHNRLRSKAA